MSLATLPAAILETVLIRLSALFLAGAGGDTTAARQAAYQILAAHHPQTEDELALAANIISFGFQSLEALSQATEPGLSPTRILRLRGSAVSLSRESAKARKSLDKLRKERQQQHAEPPDIQPPKAQPAPTAPTQAAKPNTIGAAAKAQGITWTQAYKQRQRDAALKKAEARKTPPIPAPPPAPRAPAA